MNKIRHVIIFFIGMLLLLGLASGIYYFLVVKEPVDSAIYNNLFEVFLTNGEVVRCTENNIVYSVNSMILVFDSDGNKSYIPYTSITRMNEIPKRR